MTDDGLEKNFDTCRHCGDQLDGKTSNCLNCGGPVVSRDLLYLNRLERLVHALYGKALESGIELHAKDGVSDADRDPFIVALEELVNNLRIYHWRDDGCVHHETQSDPVIDSGV